MLYLGTVVMMMLVRMARWRAGSRQAVCSLIVQPCDHRVQPFAAHQVREHERLTLSHYPGIPFHDLQAGADIRGQVDLIDHQQIALRNAWSALTRDQILLLNQHCFSNFICLLFTGQNGGNFQAKIKSCSWATTSD